VQTMQYSAVAIRLRSFRYGLRQQNEQIAH